MATYSRKCALILAALAWLAMDAAHAYVGDPVLVESVVDVNQTAVLELEASGCDRLGTTQAFPRIVTVTESQSGYIVRVNHFPDFHCENYGIGVTPPGTRYSLPLQRFPPGENQLTIIARDIHGDIFGNLIETEIGTLTLTVGSVHRVPTAPWLISMAVFLAMAALGGRALRVSR